MALVLGQTRSSPAGPVAGHAHDDRDAISFTPSFRTTSGSVLAPRGRSRVGANRSGDGANRPRGMVRIAPAPGWPWGPPHHPGHQEAGPDSHQRTGFSARSAICKGIDRDWVHIRSPVFGIRLGICWGIARLAGGPARAGVTHIDAFGMDLSHDCLADERQTLAIAIRLDV